MSSGVLCIKRIPAILKRKFYKTIVRPAMHYSSECCATTWLHMHKMKVAEMRMIRWMCGKTRKDKFRNEKIMSYSGLVPIKDKIREKRITWLGHVKRRPNTAPIRSILYWQVNGCSKKIDKPLKTWIQVVKVDFIDLNLIYYVWKNRLLWRTNIRVAYHATKIDVKCVMIMLLFFSQNSLENFETLD